MKTLHLSIVLVLSIFLMGACTPQENINEDDALTENKVNSEELQPETKTENNETNNETDNIESIKYENDKLGFEFIHDKKWIIDNERTDDSTIVFIDETGKGGENREAIKVKENAENLSLEQVVDQFIKDSDLEANKTAINDIDAEKVIKVETNSFGMNYYFILHENRIYNIQTQGNLFNEETLKTFQFK